MGSREPSPRIARKPENVSHNCRCREVSSLLLTNNVQLKMLAVKPLYPLEVDHLHFYNTFRVTETITVRQMYLMAC